MIVPRVEFRPNPDRAVHVQGRFDEELVQRLTPQILLLQHESRDPITVYIDSPGGSVQSMLALLRLLKARSQDYGVPCALITVAMRQTASAAAYLLSAGDYALAYPDSSVLYHGGSLVEEKPLTAARSSFLAQMLRMLNESSAMDLAREIEFRFIFSFIRARGAFADIRLKYQDDQMTDLDCFLNGISENLSKPANGILKAARERFARYGTLIETVEKKTKNLSPNKTPLQVEASQIKAIVDFEVRNNKDKPGWSFQHGLHTLTDDFLLFQEYQAISQSPRFKKWCSQYGRFMISADELAVINQAITEEERAEKLSETVSPILQPIWSFFVALCHTLQQGENEFLTASDAYRLGLIDEVIGNDDLIPLRIVYEEKPDTPPEPTEAPGDNAAPATTNDVLPATI